MSPLLSSPFSSALSDLRSLAHQPCETHEAEIKATQDKIGAERDAAATQFGIAAMQCNAAVASVAVAAGVAAGGVAAATTAAVVVAAGGASLGAGVALQSALITGVVMVPAATCAADAAIAATAPAIALAIAGTTLATDSAPAVMAVAEHALEHGAGAGRHAVGEGASRLVDLINELRGGEPRYPLLLPEPWRAMVSTATPL